jgi:SMC interacting uncharacterized protein involved in chromosome segregation
MDIKEFAQKVKEMRTAQSEYFKSRKAGLQAVSNDWLNKSKKLEHEVDKLTGEILAGSTTQELF